MAKSKPTTKKKAATKKAVTKKKATSKKTTTNKTSAKKTPAKKSVTKKKPFTKKSTVVKNKVTGSARKPAAGVTKATTPKKTIRKKAVVAATAKEKTQQQSNKAAVETLESTLPPVEEKSPAVNTITNGLSGMNEKSRQRAAVHQYDNHHIRLSNTKKGGPKPTGKKPLW